jgi:two-component system response regulator YesN
MSPSLTSAQQAADIVHRHFSSPSLTVGRIAKELFISESHLSMLFKKEFQTGLKAYLVAYRLDASLRLLADNQLSIEEVSIRVGFQSASYYSSVFKKRYGISPKTYAMKHVFVGSAS